MQVDRGRLLHETLSRLARLEEGEGLLLQPFKKDRALLVIVEEGGYQVLERGFARKNYMVAAQKIKKLLKTLSRKEFPRSNKVWLHVFPAAETEEIRRKFVGSA